MSACPLDFEKTGGLIPVIVQDFSTGEILMQAYINREAWDESVKTERGVYFSRSRQKLWRKGESSGNVQLLKEIRVDCDNDSVIFKIDQVGGAACHTGHRSCYYRVWEEGELKVQGEPLFNPDEVYKK
ncbi:MAG: phosphoribosyl-AMP cyclohydrolase [Spirochaetaceae bacterium 4572_59]|nr:MAG: phosphoribosyl-AMP cyclohydrolase [Spirochaetaceae bacterium 4572_59]